MDSGIFRWEFQFLYISGNYLDTPPANPDDAVAIIVTVAVAENPDLARIQDRLPGLAQELQDSSGQRLLPLWLSDLSNALSTNPFRDIPPRAIRIYENVILL
jgi:hypothetical protein